MIGNFIGAPIGGSLSVSGTLVVNAVGLSQCTSSVSGAIKAITPAVGLASGISTAVGAGASNATVGIASGSSTVIGIGGAIAHSPGLSSGKAIVLGVSGIINVVSTAGLARGFCRTDGRAQEGGARYYTLPRALGKSITGPMPKYQNITTSRSLPRQITA